MTEDQVIQEKYMQFQMLQQQMEQINQHLELLHQRNAELDISINAVKDLSEVPVGNEILAPIADGILFKAKLEDNQKLIVNVGSGTTVEKTIPEVVKLLEEQKEDLNNRIFEIQDMAQQFDQQAMQIFREVEGDVK
jgi:prefoldin alpha subunit